MKTYTLHPFIALLILLLSFSSCKKKGCTDPTAENYAADAKKDDGSCTYKDQATITLKFSHNFNGTAVSAADFDQLKYTNADGNILSITKLQYLISDVRFYRANGDSLTINGYHLIDLQDTNSFNYVLSQAVATNPFIGIGFNYGFDEEDNISGQYADLNAESWSSPEMLGGGYHQMKLEGRYIAGSGDTVSYQYHNLSRIRQINGTDTTFHPNYVHIDLPHSFSFSDNTTIELKMNINEWFQNPNIWDLDSMYTMLMPNYDAQVMMTENAYSVFSVGAVTEE
ncbi:MAG: MbnP family protein [Crocinitomicaceae bacterium]